LLKDTTLLIPVDAPDYASQASLIQTFEGWQKKEPFLYIRS